MADHRIFSSGPSVVNLALPTWDRRHSTNFVTSRKVFMIQNFELVTQYRVSVPLLFLGYEIINLV